MTELSICPKGLCYDVQALNFCSSALRWGTVEMSSAPWLQYCWILASGHRIRSDSTSHIEMLVFEVCV